MEDFKVILYILAIIAYFIYTAWRKAFKTPDEGAPPQEVEQRERPRPRPTPSPSPQPRQQQQRPVGPATSFEDILREMQSKMERVNEQERPPVVRPEPAYKAAPQPAEYETMTALSMEDPKQVRMIERRAKARKEAMAEPLIIRKQSQEQPSIYAQMLRDPQSVRQAFILTEIFNRKQY